MEVEGTAYRFAEPGMRNAAALLSPRTWRIFSPASRAATRLRGVFLSRFVNLISLATFPHLYKIEDEAAWVKLGAFLCTPVRQLN